MEKLNILDVLLTYKNDSDKIAILGKALEMIIDYTDRVEEAISNINANIQTIASAVTSLDKEVKRINGELLTLKRSVSTDISRIEDTVGTVKDTVDTVKHTSYQAPAQVTAPVSSPASQKTSIIEENLMKPSQFQKSFGGASGGTGTSPLGGGMSIRSAMMAEIKQRMRGSAPAGGSSEATKQGEIGGGYVPKIHQPRAAQNIEGGLVKKMNQLLDTKFQKMSPSSGAPPSGPPSARGPPSAPPSKKPDKKKGKKGKKDKKKDKSESQLSDLQRKIREKLG